MREIRLSGSMRGGLRLLLYILPVRDARERTPEMAPWPRLKIAN